MLGPSLSLFNSTLELILSKDKRPTDQGRHSSLIDISVAGGAQHGRYKLAINIGTAPSLALIFPGHSSAVLPTTALEFPRHSARLPGSRGA
ncbi:unnamed protein product [Gadus morhua 'NCC']